MPAILLLSSGSHDFVGKEYHWMVWTAEPIRNIKIDHWVCIISDKLKDCLFFSVQCSDDLDFMEQINQELEEPALSQEGVVKRSAITQCTCF